MAPLTLREPLTLVCCGVPDGTPHVPGCRIGDYLDSRLRPFDPRDVIRITGV